MVGYEAGADYTTGMVGYEAGADYTTGMVGYEAGADYTTGMVGYEAGADYITGMIGYEAGADYTTGMVGYEAGADYTTGMVGYEAEADYTTGMVGYEAGADNTTGMVGYEAGADTGMVGYEAGAPQSITTTILMGQTNGEDVASTTNSLLVSICPFELKRMKFPVHLSFTVSIHKDQRVTMRVTRLCLISPCFALRKLMLVQLWKIHTTTLQQDHFMLCPLKLCNFFPKFWSSQHVNTDPHIPRVDITFP